MAGTERFERPPSDLESERLTIILSSLERALLCARLLSVFFQPQSNRDLVGLRLRITHGRALQSAVNRPS